MDGVQRFLDWGRQHCLPLWLERSWDSAQGGFVEGLSLQGEPQPQLDRRFRVQARQAFVLASITHAGWDDRTGHLRDLMSWLEPRAYQQEGAGGWVHRLKPDGRVASPVRDLYDHAFILLALAWAFRVTGESRFKALADETLGFLDAEMAHPAGGYAEAIGADTLPRRQNPHMHLFEALLALHDATGEAAYLDRIRAIYHLFDTHFFDAGAGVVQEFFADDWSDLPDGRSALCEPGHGCEWVWLLAQYDRVTGADTSAQAQGLFETAMRVGINPATGLLHTTMTRSGEVIDPGSRSWMQTEWIRAALVMQARGHALAPAALERCISASERFHFGVERHGGWADQVDATGQPVGELMPTSTLYHVVGALLECERSLSRVSANI